MPIYEYRRPDGTTFELQQAFTDEPLTSDPDTGVPVTRVLHAPAVHFKGSGFYNTDYGTRKRQRELAADGSSGNGKESGADSPSADSASADSASADSASAESSSSAGKDGASSPAATDGASKGKSGNLRPNPNLFADWDYLPVFSPTAQNSSYLEGSTEADAGLSYLIERGEKRQHRLEAAKDLRPLPCRRSPIMNAR